MGCQNFPVLTSKDRSPSCENPKNQRDMVKSITESVVNHGQTAALTAQWLSQRQDQGGLGLDITKGGTEGRTVDGRGRCDKVARERSAASEIQASLPVINKSNRSPSVAALQESSGCPLAFVPLQY